ncbi:hypothetical protein MCHI_003254 [Candidatus Magnetoovum chiemensis]|nr:hypothetical protein MCHI_003254 [Candidatus Magnetoovum chiemensis]
METLWKQLLDTIKELYTINKINNIYNIKTIKKLLRDVLLIIISLMLML